MGGICVACSRGGSGQVVEAIPDVDGVERIMQEEEPFVTRPAFMEPSRSREMSAPAAPTSAERTMQYYKLLVSAGFTLFLFGILTVLVVIPGAPTHPPSYSEASFMSPFCVFRIFGSFACTVYILGVVIYCLEVERIDYAALLRIDPLASAKVILAYGVCFGVVWFIVFAAYIVDYKFLMLVQVTRKDPSMFRSSSHFLMYPMTLLVVVAIICVCSPRIKRAIFGCVTPAILPPRFPNLSFDIFMGDILTGLVKPMQDIPHVICFMMGHHQLSPQDSVCPDWEDKYVSPIIAAAPLVYCLLLCSRNFRDATAQDVGNFAKYGISVIVIVVSAFVPDHTEYGKMFIIAVSCVAAMYLIAWDIIMDWGVDCGLGQQSDKANIRKRFGFGTYLVASLFDVAGRLIWVASLWPITKLTSNVACMELLTWIMALLEIKRRGLWVVLSLEHQRVENGL